MAIIKTFDTSFGISCNYHRIRSVNFDCDTKVITITTQIFLSKESRDSGATPLWHEYVNIPFEDLTEDPRDTLYKLLENYSGSYLEGGIEDPSSPPTQDATSGVVQNA